MSLTVHPVSASEGRTMRCPWADCDWMVQWSEPPYDGRRAAGSLYDAHWRQKHKLAPIIEVAEPRADEGGEGNSDNRSRM